MFATTREDVLNRLKRTKEIKRQGIRESMEFLRGMYFAETGIIAKDSDFTVW